MRHHGLFLLLLCGLASPGTITIAADTGDKIQVEKLTPHIYKATATKRYDVNLVFSVGPDGVLLVDTAFKETASELREHIDALGFGAVKYVINTHSHVDHTGGNRVFGREAIIIAHPAVREEMGKGRYIIEEDPPEALPDITVDGTMSLFFNGEEIRIRALPGSHDNDDLMVHFTKSGIVYMGDLAYGLHYPTYDTRSGDARRYADIVAAALEGLPENTVVVSGHGKNCTMADMREYQAMLAATTSIVMEALDQGTPREAIEPSLLGKWADYAGPYQGAAGWITSLIDSRENAGKTHVPIIEPLYRARKSGGMPAAIATFNRITAENPGDYHLELYLFGQYAVDQQAWQDAAEIFALANSASPDNPFTWLFWSLQADAHAAMGQKRMAIEKYDRALKINPDYATARDKRDALIKELET